VNRNLLLLVPAFLMIHTVGTLPAEAQSLPAVRVAFVHDRSSTDWGAEFREEMRQEIGRVLEVDYTVEMPTDLDRTADGSVASVRAALEGLLGDKRVDLIVATGPLGSLEASRLPDLARPVIGAWILDPKIQQAPFKDGASGRHNYTYITVSNLLSADLAALQQVVEYEHLVVVGSAGWVAALPADGSALEQIATARTSMIVGDGTVDSILANLPDDADAIYLLPMIEMSSAEIAALLAAFSERRLPVLSLIGEPEVRAGALLGVAPSDWKQRMYRRVAQVALQILSGEDPADIPVMMLRDAGLFLNLRTASLIGVSPPFEVTLEAVIVDEIAEPGAEHLDLYSAMAVAQTRNRDIAISESAVAAGSEQTKLARAELLPQINVGLSGQVIDDDDAAFFPTLSERSLGGRATFTQSIYSDQIWAGFSIEKHLQEARVGELNKVRLDVGLEAATAYLEVLRAQTRLQVQRQNLAFTRTNLERAHFRVSAGEANRSELYRWESKVAAEQTLVLEATVIRQEAGIELNRVLDRPLETPLKLVDTTLGDQYRNLIDPRIEHYTRDPRSLEVLRSFLVQKGLAGSPELQQFDASILAAERAHTAATRSFWIPDIGFAGSVGHVLSRGGEGAPVTDPLAPDDTSWRVGLVMRLPIFEGGGRFAEARRTTQETHRLTRGREAAALRVNQDVRNAVFNVASSQLAVDLARKAAQAARLNLGIVADNYIVGLVSLVDLLDAQTNAFNTDLAAVDAVNNFLVALMRTERAVGQFTFLMPAEERSAWIEELEEYDRQRP